MESPILEGLTALCMVVGALFALTGSIGLMSLPDFYSRLHGPTKATTLGVGGILLASVIFFSAGGEGLVLRDLLITVFLFLTAPISAHMAARAALHLKVRSVSPGPADEEEFRSTSETP